MILCITLCLCFSSALATNPGYKLELTKKGLDFATSLGGQGVEKVLKNIKIPAFNGGAGKASFEVKNINFKQFSGEKWFYALNPPNTMTYGLTGASLEIDADFKGKTHIKFLPSITVPGKIKVRAKNVGLSLSNSITIDGRGRPVVKAVDCKSTIGTFTLSLSGSVAAWIVQMFHTLIEADLKPKISKTICDNAMTIINNSLGEKIVNTIPSPIPINKDFGFSYRLEDIDVSKQGLAFSGEGAIVYKGVANKAIKDPPQLVTEPKPSNKMGYFYLSDHVLNSVGQIAHNDGLLKAQVNEAVLPPLKPILRTVCPGQICIGSIVKELAEVFPNKTCTVHMETNRPPVASFDGTGILVDLNLGTTLGIYSKGESEPKAFAAANFKGSAKLSPKIVGDHISADFVLNDFNAKEIFSTLGKPINWEFINNYGKNLLGVQLKQLLKKGIDLPAVKGVKLVNPGIRTNLHTLEIATDLAVHL